MRNITLISLSVSGILRSRAGTSSMCVSILLKDNSFVGVTGFMIGALRLPDPRRILLLAIRISGVQAPASREGVGMLSATMQIARDQDHHMDEMPPPTVVYHPVEASPRQDVIKVSAHRIRSTLPETRCERLRRRIKLVHLSVIVHMVAILTAAHEAPDLRR